MPNASNVVLINAANLTGAGALAVGVNLIPPLARALAPAASYLLLPDLPAYRRLPLAGASVQWFPIHKGSHNDLARLRHLYFSLPRLARRLRPAACLTLGDVGPLRLACPHVIFLHQALLVYEPAELNGVHAWNPLKRAYLRAHFRRSLRHAARVIVQTGVMAARVAARYGFPEERITVIPQAVPAHVSAGRPAPPLPAMLDCGKPLRLLFLARCYPHKNHAILPAVAAELRRRGLASEVHIFLTVAPQAVLPELRSFLPTAADVVTNLGELPHADAAAALRASTALFLPTLVESCSMVYFEAMASGLPVLTSDRDFAHWMCAASGIYFDPLDAASIVDAIERLRARSWSPADSAAAAANLRRFPAGWDEVARRFAEVLQQAAAPRPS